MSRQEGLSRIWRNGWTRLQNTFKEANLSMRWLGRRSTSPHVWYRKRSPETGLRVRECLTLRMRLSMGQPPQANWPSDLEVPHTSFDEIIVNSSRETRKLVSNFALEQLKDQASSAWGRTFGNPPKNIDELEKEVGKDKCTLMTTMSGEVERLAAVAAIELRRPNGTVLMQLGSWDSTKGLQVACKLPGTKQEVGESAFDALLRLLKKDLLPFSNIIDLSEATAFNEVEWSRSEKYSLRTKYLRTIFQVQVNEEIDEAQLRVMRLQLEGRPKKRRASRFMMLPHKSRSFDFGQTRDFGPEVDETDAFFVESHDLIGLPHGDHQKLMICGWLHDEEADRFKGSPEGQATLLRCLSKIHVDELVISGAKERPKGPNRLAPSFLTSGRNAKTDFPEDYEAYFADDVDVCKNFAFPKVKLICEPWRPPLRCCILATRKTAMVFQEQCYMLGCFFPVDEIELGFAELSTALPFPEREELSHGPPAGWFEAAFHQLPNAMVILNDIGEVMAQNQLASDLGEGQSLVIQMCLDMVKSTQLVDPSVKYWNMRKRDVLVGSSAGTAIRIWLWRFLIGEEKGRLGICWKPIESNIMECVQRAAEKEACNQCLAPPSNETRDLILPEDHAGDLQVEAIDVHDVQSCRTSRSRVMTDHDFFPVRPSVRDALKPTSPEDMDSLPEDETQ
eukprot:symbB.v1.2.010805.t2/scaffold712.1/size170421/4